MSSTLYFIIKILLTISIYLVILRLWMQYTRVNYYNPCTQFVIKLTQPIIGPLRKMLPAIGRIDTATVSVLYLLALVKFIFVMGLIVQMPSEYYLDFRCLLGALLIIIHDFGYLIFWILLIRAILSWVSRGQSDLEEILAQLSEPLIAPIRRFIPPIGSIDLSFMIFVFVLVIANNICMEYVPYWYFISNI